MSLGKLLHLNLAGQEYWLPLLMGLSVGLIVVMALRFVARKTPPEPLPPPDPKPDYDPYQLGSSTEQRKTLRRGGNPVQIYFAPPESKDRALTGWVVDRSMGGLCLTLPEEQAADTILAVTPVNAPMSPWVDIVVRSCRPSKEGFEVGCQFVKPPPWAVLLLFG